MFTGPGKSSTRFGLRRTDLPSMLNRNNRNPSRRSASIFSEYSAAFRTATDERGLRYETECFGQAHSAATPLSRPYPLKSQGIVADRASSQHHERMNHLAALECEERGGESGIVPDVAAVSHDRCQSVLERLNGLLVHEQAENAPGKAGTGIDADACCLSQAKLR